MIHGLILDDNTQPKLRRRAQRICEEISDPAIHMAKCNILQPPAGIRM